MFKAVLLQVCATIITAAIAYIFVGARGALSAALGGMACFFPNLLFALRLYWVARTPGASQPMAFFVGEAVKVASMVGILAAIPVFYSDVHWLALLAGLFVAFKANLLAIFLKA